MNSHTVLAFRLAVTWLCCLVTVGAADWSRFRGPKHDGRSTETSWSHQWDELGPPISWTTRVGTGFSGCAVVENRLFTIGNQQNVDTVYCLNATTGESLWRHSYDSPIDPNEFEGGPTSTPTVDGQSVYTLGRRGDLFAFDVSSGKVRWTINLASEHNLPIPAWGFSGSPLVLNDRLILNAGDAGIAVDKATGKLVWSSQPRECGYASPVPIQVGGRTSVVLGSGRSYVAVDPASGDLQWRQRWLTTFGCNAADPIISGDHLFLSSGYNRGSALLDLSGPEPQIIWKHKQVQNQLTTSVLIDGHIYGASGDVSTGASLVCMELKSGEVRWNEDSVKVGGLTAAGDRLIVITDDGRLNIVRANDREYVSLASHEVFQAKCWTAPTLAGGHIYVRSADGQLAALRVSEEESR